LLVSLASLLASGRFWPAYLFPTISRGAGEGDTLVMKCDGFRED